MSIFVIFLSFGFKIQFRSAYRHNKNGECCGGAERTRGVREKATGWGGGVEREGGSRERGGEESNERILKLCANKIRGHLHLRWD